MRWWRRRHCFFYGPYFGPFGFYAHFGGKFGPWWYRMSKEEEKEYLEELKKDLEEELEEIKKRLDELK